MREDIRLLFDMVEKLLDLHEGHEKEHGAMYDAVNTSSNAAGVVVGSAADQSSREPRSRDRHRLEEKQQKQVVKSVVHEIKAIDTT